MVTMVNELTTENIEELRKMVAAAADRRQRFGISPQFSVMPDEAPFIRVLMLQHPGVGYTLRYPSPYENRGNGHA